MLGERQWPGAITHGEAIDQIIGWIEAHATNVRVAAAGHRVVFGGAAYGGPTRLDDQAIAEIEKLIAFFPLHLPHNLAAIKALAELHPALPQVACFDNSFHRTQPRVAQLFALPRRLFEQGVRRYGFHGLSYEFIARTLPEYAPEAKRVVVAHLGSGASLCALRDGESVEVRLASAASMACRWERGRVPSIPASSCICCRPSAWMPKRSKSCSTRSRACSGCPRSAMTCATSGERRSAGGGGDRAVRLHITKNLGALTAVLGGIDALSSPPASASTHRRNPGARLPRRRMAWSSPRPRRERCGRPAHYHRGQPRLGMGDPH